MRFDIDYDGKYDDVESTIVDDDDDEYDDDKRPSSGKG